MGRRDRDDGSRRQPRAGRASRLADACPEFAAYVDARIEERLALPRDEWPEDALTRFLVTEVDGERSSRATSARRSCS